MKTKTDKVLLKNEYKNMSSFKMEIADLYYPRLQVNKRGEIVLALFKQGSLTSGIMVGKTAKSKSTIPLGQKFDDWEVAGELEDYNGEITVTLKNRVKRSKVR